MFQKEGEIPQSINRSTILRGDPRKNQEWTFKLMALSINEGM